MAATMQVTRKTLSTQVRELLVERMRAGEVPWGEPINEVQLAAEIGVSRTPLREALIGLAASGLIANPEGQGFAFLPLNATELREVAPVIAALEYLALRLTPAAELPVIGEHVLALAREFSQDTATHETVMVKDDEWHHAMIAACPNTYLLAEIEGIRQTFHRYESILVPTSAAVQRVAVEHQLIAERLAEGDLAGAGEALAANWTNGADRIVSASR